MEVDNRRLTDVTSYGQSVKFWIMGRQSANRPNHKWVYCNFPLLL